MHSCRPSLLDAWRAGRDQWGPDAPRDLLRDRLASLMASFVFGAALAAFVTLIGTHDLENYDRSFFSLDRGSRMETIKVLGQPVYTLAIGLGVRLPLHGNLSASPAAILAPHLPEPITYWLLLTLAIGTAAFIVRHALEPICGRSLCWFAIFLLFFSLPVLNYTITDDWPETAVTYFTIIASVFVPHALLTVSSAPLSVTQRLLVLVSLLGVFWGVMAISHPGYWPLIGITLVFSAALVAIRTDHPLRNRLAVVGALAVVSCVVVALLAPDIVRELWVAGTVLKG